jgi:hypothetical protein
MSKDPDSQPMKNDQLEYETITFAFKINTRYVFNNSITEVEKFCQDYVADCPNSLTFSMTQLFGEI